MYLAFLLNVFYMLCNIIFIYIIDQYFLIIRNRFIYTITCKTCTCRIFSEPMCHPFRNDASHMNL
jgi:hypothetical protein